MYPSSTCAAAARYELRFRSLFRAGHAFSFPCDPRGIVLTDGMSERARLSYRSVRALVGREFAVPAVLPQ
jgi:hypothetical protein